MKNTPLKQIPVNSFNHPKPMRRFTTIPIYSLLLLLLFSGCKEQAFDEHYERPDWLRGNAWKVLEEEGNYTIFLDAVEKAGFRSLVEGKGILTVIAPDDNAMEIYMQKEGLSSIDQLSPAELKKLVGYHLVYYAFGQRRFANYNPEGTDAEEVANTAGLNYKHRTKSRDTLSVMMDEVEGKERMIFHKERFLPVFSSYIFDSKNIDAKYNYEFFYPNSTWAGTGEGFNISNATVAEYAIPTDNGYLYLVNNVVEPLETVYNQLKEEENYTSFISMYDRFKEFWFDEQTTRQYAALGDSLFILKHTSLPQIGSEWTYNGEFGLPDYANLPELSAKAFNVFAPDNAAMNRFFQDYWAPYYSSIEEVDHLPVAYLLYNHVYEGSIVFPEEITKGEITSTFGNPIIFDPDKDVEDKKIAVNGAFYGLNNVVVPDMFNSVTGPLFRNPEYKLFLYMAHQANLIQPLMGDALDFTLFIPNDEVILSTIYGGSYIYWYDPNRLVFGDEEIQVENSEGLKVTMSQGAMARFVNDHIVTEEITSISGKKVYRTRNPFSYLYITDKGVASGSSYNLPDEETHFINVEPVSGDWLNGKVYETETALIREEGSFKYLIGAATSGISTLQEFSEFSILLNQAGLIDQDRELTFLFGDNFLLFAPANEAILEAKEQGLIPENKAALANYLKYYFVPVSSNGLNDYPFPGFGVEGELKTARISSGEPAVLSLDDSGTSLQVTDGSGITANVVNEFPRIFMDGAIYQIDGVLKAE